MGYMNMPANVFCITLKYAAFTGMIVLKPFEFIEKTRFIEISFYIGFMRCSYFF
jgi:Sec-independent protein secretion pathway component TatC